MARKRPHIIADIVKEVEATAKKIRADVRRMGKDGKLGSGLTRLTADLRKGAARVAEQIEHYAREIQAAKTARTKAGKALRKRPAGKKRAAKKKTARKRAAKKRG